jgi:hypothetical protein
MERGLQRTKCREERGLVFRGGEGEKRASGEREVKTVQEKR